MQLAVAVEFGIERIRRRAANGGREQAHAAFKHGGIGLFVFGDNHDGGRADGQARILRGRFLDAACDHQADMRAVVHVVGAHRAIERVGDLFARQPDVEGNRFRALKEPIQMFVEEDKDIVMQPQSLPHAIADQEAAVKDRNLGLITRHQFAVDVDQDVFVAFVGYRIVRSSIHGAPFK